MTPAPVSPVSFRNMSLVFVVALIFSTTLQFNRSRSVMILLVPGDPQLCDESSTTVITNNGARTECVGKNASVSVVINNPSIASGETAPNARAGEGNTQTNKAATTETGGAKQELALIDLNATSPATLPPELLEEFDLETTIEQVIQKWELQNVTNAKELLTRIYQLDNTYRPDDDLIVFFHPLKSGGTSVSSVLEKGVGGVVPGSHESGSFNFKGWQEQFYRDISKHRKLYNKTLSQTEWFAKHKVIFSHSGYRRVNQPVEEAAGMYRYAKSHFPNKRVRQVTMLRDPINFVASNFNEWLCKSGKWTKKAQQYGIPQTNATNACYGYSLKELTQARLLSNKKECEGRTEKELKQKKVNRRRICKAYQAGQLDESPSCSSIHNFLRNYDTQNILSNLHHYPKPAKNTVPVEHYVQDAMKYLGGIDEDTAAAAGDVGKRSPPYGGDMMWFGITERMKESMCMLHYRLNIPWKESPRRRMQSCRPITYWTDDDKEFFHKVNGLAGVLHRGANAVLDIQLARVRQEILQKKKDNVPVPEGVESCMVPKE